MNDSLLLEFMLMALIMVVTPGADTMLTLRLSISGGKSAGFAGTAGVVVGTVCHALLAALGVSMILVKSAQMFEFVKLCGALYLVYLGLSSIISARRLGEGSLDLVTPTEERLSIQKAFFQGFVSNILNPKVSVFYLTILPLFIRKSDHALERSFLLSAIQILFVLCWLSIVTVAAVAFRKKLSKPRVQKVTGGVVGVTLIGFGIKLAVTPFQKA